MQQLKVTIENNHWLLEVSFLDNGRWLAKKYLTEPEVILIRESAIPVVLVWYIRLEKYLRSF